MIGQTSTSLCPVLLIKDNPLASAPEVIQKYFYQLKSNVDELPPLEHGLKINKSQKPKCTRKLKENDKYYMCKTCSNDKLLDQMVLCEDCFQTELHNGHAFEEKHMNCKIESASCDCGRLIRIKKEGTCSAHKNCLKDVELNQEDVHIFNQLFRSLFQVLAFVEEKGDQIKTKIASLISKTIFSLCCDSYYYIKLTINMLCAENETGSTSVVYPLKKFFQYPQFCSMLYELLVDEDFLLKIGEVYFDIQNEGNILIYRFGEVRRQILDSSAFLLKMAKSGIYFIQELDNYFCICAQMTQSEEKQQLIRELITNIADKLDISEYIDRICVILKHDQEEFLKSENFQIHVLSCILKHFKKSKEKNEGEQKCQKQITSEEKSVLRKSMIILSKVLQTRSSKDIRRYQSSLSCFIKESSEMKELLQLLVENFMTAQLYNDFSNGKLRQIFIVLLLIIDQQPKQQRISFLNQFWKSVIDIEKPFFENLESIYGVLSFLGNSYRVFPMLGLDQQTQYNLTEKQQKECLLKSYLYENKEVSKKMLWTEHQKGWLKFSSCGKILKELCEFNNGHETFVYKSKNSYPNGCTKLPTELSKNWENVRGMDLTYNSSSFIKSKTLLNLFHILFKEEEFFQVFSQAFSKGMEGVEKEARQLEKWKNKGVGENYVITLLLIDKLCNGKQDPSIKEEIEKIRQNKQEYRFRFTEIGNEDKIKKLLCLEEIQAKIEDKIIAEKSEEDLKKEELAKKSQEKKQKMHNKIKEKQKQMLLKMKNEKSAAYEEEEDNFCLSCKDREKKDNEFVNLIHLTKGNTVSQILHADESKTSMKISTNLHTIHLSCFKDVRKKNMEFQCPLCKENINCFLPYRPNRASKQTINICWNVINAVLVSTFNHYETGCLFEVLLIALVESLSFTELLTAKKSKNIVKIKNKSDLFLIDMMSCIFTFSSEQDKTKYRETFNNLRASIRTCTKKELQMFQMVILEAVFLRISGQSQIDYSLVEKLSKIMVPEELEILKNTLMFITQGDSDLISSFDDLSLSRISEHSINESPQRKRQQPTSLDHIPENANQDQQFPLKQQMMMEQSQRKILGINVWTPPISFTVFNQRKFLSSLSSNQKCACDSDKIESVCLLCRRLFCDKCEDDKYHEELHMSNLMLLNMDSLRLLVKKNGKNEKVEIYYNEFMIEYKKGNDQSDSEAEEDQLLNLFSSKKKTTVSSSEYSLNKTKFTQIVEKFYNIV